MKILFISLMEGFPWGGSEELWYRTALLALQEGHSVGVSALDWKQNTSKQILELPSKGANLYLRKKFDSNSFFVRLKAKILKKRSQLYWKKLIFRVSPDFICISQGGTFDFKDCPDLVETLLTINRPYFIISQHNTEVGRIISSPGRRKVIEFINNAQSFFFVSKRNLKVAQRQLAGNIKKFISISNPLNVNIAHKPLEIPELIDTLKMACVGRLDVDYKGQDLLIEALSTGQWRNRDYVLNFYGAGPHFDYLKELIFYYKLEDKVKLKGQTDNVNDVWKEHHLMVLPSISEGTSLAMLEAMFNGRAVLGTDVGDCGEYIINNETGFLIPAGSTKALEEGLELVWKNKDRLEQLGKQAHQRVLAITDLTPEKTLLRTIITKP